MARKLKIREWRRGRGGKIRQRTHTLKVGGISFIGGTMQRKGKELVGEVSIGEPNGSTDIKFTMRNVKKALQIVVTIESERAKKR